MSVYDESRNQIMSLMVLHRHFPGRTEEDQEKNSHRSAARLGHDDVCSNDIMPTTLIGTIILLKKTLLPLLLNRIKPIIC
jgi:hypothetical protein